MYVVFLRFSNNKGKAGDFMLAHNEWIKRGFDEGVFLIVGSLQPQLGGAVVADNTTRDELEARVREDPFVAHDVVKAELFDVLPSKVDPRLAFLLT
ncbi:YciI family protein [Sorangium sp. So ce1078]|uniref:YciI family protein n=1 Tax=Sorangium sp. So ce1078 TaxID=3133329 RepID=UPI003F5D7827